MSKRSGRKMPRRRRGVVIFLIIVGGVLFVAMISMITYSQLEGKPSPIATRAIQYKDAFFRKVAQLNQGKEGHLVAVAPEEIPAQQAEDVLGEEEEKEDPLEDLVYETNIDDQQNEVLIKVIQVEMKDDYLIVRFDIVNSSGSTLYFPYHGTYASFSENGGTMYRDSDKESGVGYDQITSVIEPGETIIGKISYSPLLYRDKPFTIYINSMKFREKEADWRSFEFFFDPAEYQL